MLEKKSAKGNLDGKKTTFALIGFVFVLGLVYVGFELFASQLNTKIMAVNDAEFETVVDEQVQSTDQTPPPAPLQPQPQEVVFQVVTTGGNIDIDWLWPEFDPNEAIQEPQKIDDPIIGDVDIAPPVRFAEKQPEFPGGMEKFYELLKNELKYPETALKGNIQGMVVIEFVVEKDGRITAPKATHSLFPDCDKEAIRALLQLPKWNPGEQLGKPVRCYYTIPIRFSLQ